MTSSQALQGESHNGVSNNKRRICIFGSSANPPTGDQGHVGIVRALSSTRVFDEIRVVPVYQHPFSTKRKQLAPFEHRMAMCQLAFDGIPKVVVSNAEEMLYHQKVLECEQEERDTTAAKNGNNNNRNNNNTISIGTADLLEYFGQEGEECTLCLGADTFLDLMSGKWQRTQDIMDLCQGRFVVLYRKEDSEQNEWEKTVIQEEQEHILQDTPKYCPQQHEQLQQAIQQLNDTYKHENSSSGAQLLHVPTLGSVSSTLIRTLSSASSLGNYNANTNSNSNDNSRHGSASSADNTNEQLQQQQQQRQMADEYLKRSVAPQVFEYMVQHELYGFSNS